MATPLGHLLAGAAVGGALAPAGALRTGVLAGALLGAAADLDFLPGLLVGDPARFHHAATHSLVFALAAGVAASLLTRERRRWLLLAALAYASHLGLDAITTDPSAPHGVPLLWPVSPVTFGGVDVPLPPVLHSNGETFSWHNVRVALLELALSLPLVAVLLARTRGRFARPATGPVVAAKR